MDMDVDTSTAGQLSMVASISFCPEQMSLIEAVEHQVAESSSGVTCVVKGVSKPVKGFK